MRTFLVHSVLAVIAAGGLCGPAAAHDKKDAPSLQRSNRYPLIHPLLDIEYQVAFTELKPFRDKVQALVERLTEQGRAVRISVYFRDLNNGYWTGVDERREFTPASLLKVPLMMTIFREAESDPTLLSRRLTCSSEELSRHPMSIDVPPASPVQPGMTYSVEDLMRRMVSDSDNGAAVMLAGLVTREALEETFSDLGVELSTPGAVSGPLSVKQYASFFRMLYNASYLGKAESEKALEHLAASSFKKGLAAGVPEGVTVAHKFGERFVEGQSVRQLHDCGIIYHPKEHYLLCVMTQGRDGPALAGAIAEVSRLVYGEVDAQLSVRKR
ncbi:MAG: serine hydrolase [Elusimicrobia bacterium]|nr:serine hydrolase [Elusimicrobiota bacterium]